MIEPKIEVDSFHTCFDCLKFDCPIYKGKKIKALTRKEIAIVLECNLKRIGYCTIQQRKFYKEREEIERLQRKVCANYAKLRQEERLRLKDTESEK